jgi:uncharacterized protein
MSDWLLLAGAGVMAGVIGSAGGITSLVSYAALLAVGIPPLAANVTNSVALLGSGGGSAVRARGDVRDHRGTLREWMPITIAFSIAGAGLLIYTPGKVFDRVVPFLIAAGSLILLSQPVVAAAIERRGVEPGRIAMIGLGGAVAVYNGYFGAGSGILMMALLLLTTEPVLYRANALKNVILAGSDLLPAILFAIVGTVVWSAAWPLCLGAVAGGLTGPTITRRVPARAMRITIALFGLGFAAWLLVHP